MSIETYIMYINLKTTSNMLWCLLLLLAPSLSNTDQRLNLWRVKRSIVLVDLPTFRTQDLICHNKYRRLHGVQPLALDNELNKVAQEYAEHLAQNDSGLFHSGNKYGENLYRSRNYIVDGAAACFNYYTEEKFYNYSLEVQNHGNTVGHFTQLVSKASCFMGTGFAKSKSGWIYVVENYNPPGNVRGQFKKNVYPPGGIDQTMLSPLDVALSKPWCSIPDRSTQLMINLNCQNAIRKMYGVPPVIYTYEMNKRAQNHAQLLAERGKDFLYPPISYNYQTTMMRTTNTKVIGDVVCQVMSTNLQKYNATFYKSLDNVTAFKFNDLPFLLMTWNSTRHMGYGAELTKNGSFAYIVVMYDPVDFHPKNHRKNIFPRVIHDQKTITPPLLSNFSQFREENLNCHNVYRKKHGAQPLLYSNYLDSRANKLAKDLAVLKNVELLSLATYINSISIINATVSGNFACEYWYKGIKHYNFSYPPTDESKDFSSFSLMIWKRSKYTGLGYAKTELGEIVVVATYEPTGNSVGGFKENVLPDMSNTEITTSRSIYSEKDGNTMKNDIEGDGLLGNRTKILPNQNVNCFNVTIVKPGAFTGLDSKKQNVTDQKHLGNNNETYQEDDHWYFQLSWRMDHVMTNLFGINFSATKQKPASAKLMN